MLPSFLKDSFAGYSIHTSQFSVVFCLFCFCFNVRIFWKHADIGNLRGVRPVILLFLANLFCIISVFVDMLLKQALRAAVIKECSGHILSHAHHFIDGRWAAALQRTWQQGMPSAGQR